MGLKLRPKKIALVSKSVVASNYNTTFTKKPTHADVSNFNFKTKTNNLQKFLYKKKVSAMFDQQSHWMAAAAYIV